MKRKIIICFILTAITLLSSCAAKSVGIIPSSETPDSAAGEYHKISSEEAKIMMESGGVTVVDVRRPEEYAEKHIPGAILVSNETIAEKSDEMLPDKEAVLLIYCRTGVRSKQASDKLIKLGYKNVYDFGGIADWQYETESGVTE